jgi:hypothetical protein
MVEGESDRVEAAAKGLRESGEHGETACLCRGQRQGRYEGTKPMRSGASASGDHRARLFAALRMMVEDGCA